MRRRGRSGRNKPSRGISCCALLPLRHAPGPPRGWGNGHATRERWAAAALAQPDDATLLRRCAPTPDGVAALPARRLLLLPAEPLPDLSGRGLDVAAGVDARASALVHRGPRRPRTRPAQARALRDRDRRARRGAAPDGASRGLRPGRGEGGHGRGRELRGRRGRDARPLPAGRLILPQRTAATSGWKDATALSIFELSFTLDERSSPVSTISPSRPETRGARSPRQLPTT